MFGPLATLVYLLTTKSQVVLDAPLADTLASLVQNTETSVVSVVEKLGSFLESKPFILGSDAGAYDFVVASYVSPLIQSLPSPLSEKVSTWLNATIKHEVWTTAQTKMSKPVKARGGADATPKKDAPAAEAAPATPTEAGKPETKKAKKEAKPKDKKAAATPVPTGPVFSRLHGEKGNFLHTAADFGITFAQYLIDIFTDAIYAAYPYAKEAGQGAADVQIASDKFAHQYQCNSALSLFARLKAYKPADASVELVPAPPKNPVECAKAIMEQVKADNVIGKLEVSGPGYINIYIGEDYFLGRLYHTLQNGIWSARPVGVEPRSVAIDYSSPNIAKEMHIGHLRSTIIGDTISRILEFCGHTVERINHVGDWGTQFGMLIAHLKDLQASGKVDMDNIDASLADLTNFYKAAKKRADDEEGFKQRAHAEVVALQAGDATNLDLWKRMVNASANMFNVVYDMLKVDPRLKIVGESFYNDKIGAIIDELQQKNLLEVSDGALVMHIPGYEVPLMVKKRDGGIGYDSTDLTAIHYRTQVQNHNWLIYVVDAGQGLHFELVFAGARVAGWYTPAPGTEPTNGKPVIESKFPEKAVVARVEHSSFGVVQGEDRKKFKTRDGSTVRLVDVLEQARVKARAVMEERNQNSQEKFSEEYIDFASKELGYGGVKYFDLRQNRTLDYVFSYDRMLSPDGDTVVYLQYTHARLCSILRRGVENGITSEVLVRPLKEGEWYDSLFQFKEKVERDLVHELCRFQDVLVAIQQDLMPHRICEFLFRVATLVNDFYRDCQIFNSEVPESLRLPRLRLVHLACMTIKQALGLLGITALERM